MATEQEMDRLHAVVPAAQFCARRWGVPASVSLAQWIIESSWGTSQLTVRANNCFGVKVNNRSTPESYVEMPTAEYEAGQRVVTEALFARYATVDDSFKAHAQLIATAARYRRAMLSAAHPEAFCVALQQGGYSTNPNYAVELMQLIREHNLTQYDVPPAPEPAEQQEAA